MSAPRYLADNNFNEHIVDGVLRREPAAEFHKIREVGRADWSDPHILEFAAAQGMVVVSHDVKTMRPAAHERVANGQLMRGLFVVSQDSPIAPIIDNLILVWSATDADEWIGQIRYLPIK